MSIDTKPETAAAGTAADFCPVCRERLAGAYCHRCGEERFDPASLGLRRFAGKTFQELTDLEHSKIFRTFRSLLARPGFLTNEFVAGRKNLYLSPLKVLLVTLAVYFFLYTFYQPVAVYDLNTMIANDWTGQWPKMIAQLAARKRVTPDVLVAEVTEKWQAYMSLLQLSNVVLCAVLLWLLQLLSGRYFVEHFVFSLHFFSFTYLLSALLWPLYVLVGVGLTKTALGFSAVVVAAMIAYLFFAMRAVYRESHVVTLAKAGAFYLGSYLSMAGLMLLTLALAFAHVFLLL
jgi:hypothetical protein